MTKTLISVLIGLSFCSSTFAAGNNTGMDADTQNPYVSMCKQATRIPAQYGGESDLKGNPKLDNYCKCFSEKFMARLLHTNVNQPQPAEKKAAEELEMRTSCRAQNGLPAPKPIEKIKIPE